MDPVLSRIIMLSAFSVLFGVAFYVFLGSTLIATTDKEFREVIVRSNYSAHEEVHHLSGMLLLPSECYDLTVRTNDLDPDTTVLIFETWEQPYRDCVNEWTPRAFKIDLFAPKNISFRAILDDSWIPVTFVREN